MQQPTLLIVDDDLPGREALRALLAPHSYRLLLASDGNEALAQAAACPPDLILLDVMLPGMDGFEVCRRLRADQLLAEVPIIMVTALDDRAALLRGIEAGADDFLTKPFDRIELQARVRTITRLNRYRRLLVERKRAEVLEEERRQIAYELHDGLAQLITSTHQHLQAFIGHYRPRSPQARAELARISALAQRSVKEVRRVIAGLRPSALDDFGLATALQMQVDALRAEGWEVTYQEALGDERLPAAVETVVYRVVMEALTNIRKHAQTTRAHLGIQRHAHGLELVVQDWGCGFDLSAPPRGAGPGERVGLHGMRERIAMLGGRWSIESQPGIGTRVRAEIPLRGAMEGESIP